MALLVSIFFGFVPMFLYAAFIYWLDRYEKEPKALLGAAFMWGVIIAAGGAFIINTVFGIGIYIFTGSEALTNLGTTSVVAPVVEEILKGLAVAIVFFMFRKEFDSIMDFDNSGFERQGDLPFLSRAGRTGAQKGTIPAP